MKHIYTLGKKDIEKKHIVVVDCLCCGKTKKHSLVDVMGRVLPIDVGRKLYISDKGNLYLTES